MKPVVTLILMLLGAFPAVAAPNRLTIHNQEYFLNGVNVSWNAFGTDVGRHDQWGVLHDIDFFRGMFETLRESGANSARWWVHCDGRSNPEFDGNGMVTGVDSEFFDHFDAIMDAAAENGVLVMPALWSFDMAKDQRDEAGPYGGMHADLVSDSLHTLSYIRNCLIPMVERYAGHAALAAWEICNEPEWMLETDGSTTQRVSSAELQRFHGMIAAAIHRTDPSVLVTTGSASLKWNWDNPNGSERNLWSDSALQRAAGDTLAYLDFYQVHYYSWMRGAGWSYSPFDRHASYWKLDKPVVIGEFSGKGESGYRSVSEMYLGALDSSYAGAFAWTYAGVDSHGSWSDLKGGIESVFEAAPTAVRPSSSVISHATPLRRMVPWAGALGSREVVVGLDGRRVTGPAASSTAQLLITTEASGSKGLLRTARENR